MSVEEFLQWSAGQCDRWELFDGVPVAMSPERVVHGDTEYRVARALDIAITRTKIPCRFVLDSVAVRIDARTSFQPDALVYCGEPASPDAVEIADPIIVIEVLSPGNAIRDLRDKLQGYFRVSTIQHYLIIDPDKRLILHHARRGDEEIVTRIATGGAIKLDPPGLEFGPVSALFGPGLPGPEEAGVKGS